MFKSLIFGAMLMLVGFIFGGCGTTTLQTKSDLTRTVSLTPKQLNIKKVYLRVTGTEASIIQPKALIAEKLESMGIAVTDNPDDADTMLHVNTLFADNLKEAKNYSVAGAAGVLGGTAVGVHNSSGSDGIIAGVAIALAMGIAQNMLADDIYRSISDVIIMQKQSDGEWLEIGKTRIVSEAVKMGLKDEEAKPVLENDVATRVVSIFQK